MPKANRGLDSVCGEQFAPFQVAVIIFTFMDVANDYIVEGAGDVTCGKEASEDAYFGGEFMGSAFGVIFFGVLGLGFVGGLLLRR